MRLPVLNFEGALRRDGFKEFYLFVLIFALFHLALIWSLDFPPLQDYPMRMFIGFAASTFDNPAYNWADFFELHNSYGSYSFTFWFIRLFTPYFGIEATGKLFLSLYVCLVAALALVESRRRENVPWPLLMLFPLAFNQTYIIGLMGYFISIPVLILALRHFESVTEKPLAPRRFASHLPFQAVIFFLHPMACALYIGLSGVVCLFKRGRPLLRSVFLLCAFALFFVLWYMSSSSGGNFVFSPLWWSFSATLDFFLLMFSGMKITNGADWIAVSLWCAAAVFLAYSAFRLRGKLHFARLDLLMFALVFIGFFSFPFSPGAPYTYFNIRLVALVYFFGAIVLSNIALCRFAGRVFAVLIAAITIWQGILHYRLSVEIGQIAPVISKMEKNSVVLPVVADGKSVYLDPVYFYQFHDHVPEYYHFLVGGGANPYFIDDLPAWPIHYRHPQKMLEVLSSRNLEDYSCCYRYVMARGDRFQSVEFLGPFRSIARSGKWVLFEAPSDSQDYPRGFDTLHP